MKYLILSKNDIKGVPGDDSSEDGDITKYFELGWESIGSRFELIKLVNLNSINQDNVTAVTIKDRMFMYEDFYRNVISYEDFKEKNIPEKDICFDCTQFYDKIGASNPSKGFIQVQSKPRILKYYRYLKDGELIRNGFNLSGAINPENNFVVLGIRNRGWVEHRNSDKSFFKIVANNLRQGHNIYVAGKCNEDFCKKNGFTYIESLKDYVALIKHEKCKGLITQACGLAVLAITCADCDIHLLDNSRCSSLDGICAIDGGQQTHFYTKKLYPYFDLEIGTVNLITERIENG